MHVRSTRRGVASAIPVLWITALVAVCCTGTAIAAVRSSASAVATQTKLAGKWKGQYGGAFKGHFTLHWKQTGKTLSGSITLSSPSGTYHITGSLLSHNKIKFGAVSVGAKYKGTWNGSKMSGTWTSPRGGGSWSAHKA